MKCNYGKSLDKYGYHLITCKNGSGPVWSHNSVVRVWSECFSKLCIVHKIEPKHRFTESDCRPHIFAIDPRLSEDIELDVS